MALLSRVSFALFAGPSRDTGKSDRTFPGSMLPAAMTPGDEQTKGLLLVL